MVIVAARLLLIGSSASFTYISMERFWGGTPERRVEARVARGAPRPAQEDGAHA
ncbi:MAG: hypothetical protein JNN18_16270 [Rubrivivax sp.]|nr:hypothetical protein [Rubrivivax sp.]